MSTIHSPHITEWQCPNCGWFPEEEYENTNCVISDIETNFDMVKEYGSFNALEWLEHWTCAICGYEFTIKNGNY